MKQLQTSAPLTVLMAEDDLDDQELFQEALLSIDPTIKLHSFTSGKKFLSELETLENPPQLVILDYNIPEMNGAEILQLMSTKEQFQPIIKIVWSTSNSPFYKNSCLASGASAYFVKPSTLSGITEMAKEMLDFVK